MTLFPLTQAKLLSTKEIELLKPTLTEWAIEPLKIKRVFEFENFIQAFAFMTQVAMLSERMNHHPNWSNVFSKVSIELFTHDLGGISQLDIELAKAINALQFK